MERNSNAVFSSNVQPYPLYNEKQFMTFHQTNNPTVVNSFAANPQYLKNNAMIQPQVYPQSLPVQNYRVSATSPIRVSQAALQPQVMVSPARQIFVNANQGTRVSYDANPNVVGVAIPQTSQSVVQRKMVPVTQYVPVDVIEPMPLVAVSPPPPAIYNVNSAIYAEPVPLTQAQQRVIVHQPDIYEKRQIKYTPPPPKVSAVQKIVVQEPKQEAYKDPMVQTVPKSFDAASVRSSRIAPPPAKPQETKTPCATWLLALLGLLGLIGLILAIVLSQNSKNSTTVQSASPTVADPQRVSSVAPNATAKNIAPTKDVSKAEVKGQTVITTPTPVAVPSQTIQPVPTVTPPKPTDISVTQPALTTTQTTVLSGVQPQTISPTYVNTPQTTSTTSSTTTTSTTQPMTVQPVLTPGNQVTTSTTSATSTNTQTTSVQPTASTVQPTSVQPTTTSGSTNWIPAASSSTSPSSSSSTSVAPQPVTWTGSTSVTPTATTSPTASPQPATTTSTSTTSTTPTTTSPTTVAPQSQSISATPVASSTTPTTTTTTTTTTTVSTKPSHFLALRHHL